MESDRLLEFLSAQNSNGDNYFHEICQGSSIDNLLRVAKFMNYPIPAILGKRNAKGEQCTHIIVKNQKDCAVEMMKIVVDLGAYINDQEKFSGFTPLHLCVKTKNYQLANWICELPYVNLDIRNFKGHTAYYMAYESADQKMMNILKKARTMSKPSFVRAEKVWDHETQSLFEMLSDSKKTKPHFQH